MKRQELILTALIVLSLMLFLVTGFFSPKGEIAVSPPYWNQSLSAQSSNNQTNLSAPMFISNCTSPNVNFSYYGAISSVSAKTGSSSVSEIYVTDTGNVTENISIAATLVGNVPFTVEVPSATADTVNKTVYFQYIIPNIQTTGLYTIQMKILATSGKCERYVSFPISVNITS